MQSGEAQQMLMRALGIQSAFWGLGRIAGELYAVLYTASDPLTLSDIARELGVAKSNVSVAIRRLEDLGMVQRHYAHGDRRVYFVANSDFWQIARHFLERRYHPTFAESFQLVDDSLQAAQVEGNGFVWDRIHRLKAFYDGLDQLTNWILALQPAELVRVLEWTSRGAMRSASHQGSTPRE